MEMKLMQRGTYEQADELESLLQQSFTSFQSQLNSPYQMATVPAAQRNHLTQALLFAMMVQPQNASTFLNSLTTTNTDGYAFFVSLLIRLVNESYTRLFDHVRTQILWLLRHLITLVATDTDNLFLSLLRQVAGGDLSTGNLWLASQLLDVVNNNMAWLVDNSAALTSALFTYLRLLPDHCMAKASSVNELRQNEISFCVLVLRENFQDCLQIGRDLVRLLQDVACIPEFESIWRDILSNPSVFRTPEFTDISQIYAVRTPNKYIQSRITPEMETQIRFLLTYVRMGNQRRYQSWFAQRFLSQPESETLVCDLIRFICCVHHPTNQILQSDIVQRWALVGWLLKCCKSNHGEANAKLALFYDWFFYMSKSDNIMNIEPAILVMVHSVHKYADMTNSLLDFLFLLTEHYDPFRKDLIRRGVVASVDILVGKGVVRSLEPLTASPRVANVLKEKLLALFPTYCKIVDGDPSRGLRLDLAPQDSPGGGHLVTQSGSANKSGAILSPSGHARLMEEPTDISGGNQTQMLEDKGGDEEFISSDSNGRKRKRVDFGITGFVPQFQQISKTLSISKDAAGNLLENILKSFYSMQEHAQEVEIGLEGLQLSQKFASTLAEVLKKGGYDLFSPLVGLPSDKPEGDESMSITSTLLRLYVRSPHPQLQQMLVFWQCEGYPVSSRFLCYVSRLAEEFEMSVTTASGLRAYIDDYSKTEVIDDSNVKKTEGVKDTPNSEEADDENGECLDRNDDSQCQSGWEQKVQVPAYLELRHRELKVRFRAAVADSFKAYEAFLKSICSKSTPCSSPFSKQLSESNSQVDSGKQFEVQDFEPEKIFMNDLRTCLLWNINRLQRVLWTIFRYLPNLAAGKEEVLHIALSVLRPADIANLEFRLSLKEFSIIGHEDALTRLIRASLNWDSIEQQYFWRLIAADAQSMDISSVSVALRFCSPCLNPLLHVEALSGILSLLKLQPLTPKLVSTVLYLPPSFAQVATAIFVNWISSNYSALASCFQQITDKSLGDDSDAGCLVPVINYLEDCGSYKGPSDESAKIAEIKQSLFKFSKGGCVGASSGAAG